MAGIPQTPTVYPPAKSADRGGPFVAAELSPERRDRMIDELAGRVIRRRLAAPAVFFLELHKPLTTLAAIAVTFSQPTLGALFGFRRMAEWAALLDERENIERLIRCIEARATANRESA
jgi:hypothetical protein